VNRRDTQFLLDVAGEHITMQEMTEAMGGMALFNTTPDERDGRAAQLLHADVYATGWRTSGRAARNCG
jgi:hypothetical protein